MVGKASFRLLNKVSSFPRKRESNLTCAGMQEMPAKQPAVYILASGESGTLYIGITGWLKHRIWEHREGLVEGFSKRHGLRHLVWFKYFADFPSAITHEKQLKKWNRAWKIELVEKTNPEWRDLWLQLLD